MNANYLIAALVALAGPALAQSASSTSGVTRAQVQAEVARARAAGELPLSEASFLPYQFASAAVAAAQVTSKPVPAQLNRAAGDIRETGTDNNVDRSHAK